MASVELYVFQLESTKTEYIISLRTDHGFFTSQEIFGYATKTKEI